MTRTRTAIGIAAASAVAVIGGLVWLGPIGHSESPRDAQRSTLDREAQAQRKQMREAEQATHESMGR